jgi:hypothetical protein
MEDIEGKKCESIYYNLLECHRKKGDQNILATFYIREFWHTKRCDKFHDFTPFRNELENHIGKPSLDRILTRQDVDSDLVNATQACLHYHRWHEENLVAALSWPKWIQYQTLDRGERLLATVGLVGAGYGGEDEEIDRLLCY